MIKKVISQREVNDFFNRMQVFRTENIKNIAVNKLTS